ncbi:hypothetical protein KJ980_01535 [Patescibacteria group bacterium]|nr:hypothetical protein [Patescibacteria group bacterium]MBU4016636.1 hypothetical protein [Patescibacteria group bacterium]MBU4098309.1 hypothetical protein [Patescibacteria group bacterium]
MFTKDQIKQIQELFKAERQYTKEMVGGIVRREIGKTETNLSKQITDVNNRVTESDARMEAGFLSIKKQQDQDRRDWTDFFNEAGLFFDEMRNKLMRRIERIENHLDLPSLKG